MNDAKNVGGKLRDELALPTMKKHDLIDGIFFIRNTDYDNKVWTYRVFFTDSSGKDGHVEFDIPFSEPISDGIVQSKFDRLIGEEMERRTPKGPVSRIVGEPPEFDLEKFVLGSLDYVPGSLIISKEYTLDNSLVSHVFFLMRNEHQRRMVKFVITFEERDRPLLENPHGFEEALVLRAAEEVSEYAKRNGLYEQ